MCTGNTMDDEAMLNEAEAAVEKVLIDYGYATHGMVIIIDTTNPNLESEVLCATSDNLRAWQSLGLLEFAKTLEIGGLMNGDGDGGV